jgi:protein-S-isoprenylcysteine O-methyltransferase Ste14
MNSLDDTTQQQTAKKKHKCKCITLKGLGIAGTNLLLTLLYLFFLSAHLKAFRQEPRLSILLLSLFETIIIVLVITRHSALRTSLSWQAWLATAGGTFLPLLFRPTEVGTDLLVAQALQVTGFALQITSALSLGQSFGLLPAQRKIKINGMYRLVRHPLYLSYLIGQAGYLLNNPTSWNLGVLVVATAFQATRIVQEESFLFADSEYNAYTRLVRWRLVPGLW